MEFSGEKYEKIYLHFPSFHKTNGSWNPCSWKTMIYLYYTLSSMTVDGLATKGARATATTMLKYWCKIFQSQHQGADSIKRCHLTSIGNPIVEIRRSYDRLISTMGFLVLYWKDDVFILNQGPEGLTHACKHQQLESSLVQIMAWHLYSARPFSEPMLTYC